MAELVVREVDPAIVAKLQERAEKHRRSVEEHRAILRDVMLSGLSSINLRHAHRPARARRLRAKSPANP
jgi:plasmid stability protein